jgi:hypothetical protein
MNELCRLIWGGLIGFFRSRASLEAEIVVLRNQLNILPRKSGKRPNFGSFDRLIFTRTFAGSLTSCRRDFSAYLR